MGFIDEEEATDGFAIFENIMNVFFAIDIVISFFSAYYDQNENLILDKKVLYKYL